MSKFILKYRYDSWQLGCDCCSESVSEITVYDSEGHWVDEISYAPCIEDVDELHDYIRENHDQWLDFEVHDDTMWF